MSFDKQWYEEKFKELLEKRDKGKFFIRPSTAAFKINLYQKKGENSFRIATSLLRAAKEKKTREINGLPDELFLNYSLIWRFLG